MTWEEYESEQRHKWERLDTLRKQFAKLSTFPERLAFWKEHRLGPGSYRSEREGQEWELRLHPQTDEEHRLLNKYQVEFHREELHNAPEEFYLFTLPPGAKELDWDYLRKNPERFPITLEQLKADYQKRLTKAPSQRTLLQSEIAATRDWGNRPILKEAFDRLYHTRVSGRDFDFYDASDRKGISPQWIQLAAVWDRVEYLVFLETELARVEKREQGANADRGEEPTKDEELEKFVSKHRIDAYQRLEKRLKDAGYLSDDNRWLKDALSLAKLLALLKENNHFPAWEPGTKKPFTAAKIRPYFETRYHITIPKKYVEPGELNKHLRFNQFSHLFSGH